MMPREDILHWLREQDANQLAELWRLADTARLAHVGPAVHLRGLVEISSHCIRSCTYCGLRAANTLLPRYRMTDEEIRDCAQQAVKNGYGTLVMQAGEDPLLTGPRIAKIVRWIKQCTPLAVTLSLGERDEADLRRWREAGADRYLLRFETSDRQLFERIHPALPGVRSDRLAMLQRLRELGYEIGGGVMIGIPGQTYGTLADDILTFARLDLDMIGVGPFIAHPQTPLGRGELPRNIATEEQVPADELMVYKVIALARLACPHANIPATTALATINPANGREFGLSRGGNVVMPNLTPVRYRQMYEIYPGKACVTESAEQCDRCLRGRIARIGRTVGQGQGGRRRAG